MLKSFTIARKQYEQATKLLAQANTAKMLAETGLAAIMNGIADAPEPVIVHSVNENNGVYTINVMVPDVAESATAL